MAAHALAQAQVEDRRVVQRLGVEHEHRVGELQVAGARLQCRLGQRTQELELEAAGTSRVEVRRAQALAHDARQQQPLLAGALAARERARACARSREAGRRLTQCALPGNCPQRAAVADEGLGDALV